MSGKWQEVVCILKKGFVTEMICFYCTSFLSFKHVVVQVTLLWLKPVIMTLSPRCSVDFWVEDKKLLVLEVKTFRNFWQKIQNVPEVILWWEMFGMEHHRMKRQQEFFSCEHIQCIGDFSIFLYASSCFDLFAYAACQWMWFFARS